MRWLPRGLLDGLNAGTRDSNRAVVYRGKKKVDWHCAEAVAKLLQRSRWDLDVEFVGPKEEQQLSREVLDNAALYVQPGGGTLEKAYQRLREHKDDIRGYVAGGGRYLGVCLGGYLAGATPGFGLLPGDTDQYIGLRGATVSHDDDTVVPLLWRGQHRVMYFQDGPHFILDDEDGVEVVARYTNGAVAALVAPFGRGRVAVIGPHPEASDDWFEDIDVPVQEADCRDLGLDLLDTLMQGHGTVAS